MKKRTQRRALWAAALHGAWEYAQCPPFYDMGTMTGLRHHALMIAATIGDVPITLGVAAAAERLTSERDVRETTARGTAAMLGAGLVAAAGLEWGAQKLRLWRYTERMPTVRVLDHEVGLAPIVQVTALAVWLAERTRH